MTFVVAKIVIFLIPLLNRRGNICTGTGQFNNFVNIMFVRIYVKKYSFCIVYKIVLYLYHYRRNLQTSHPIHNSLNRIRLILASSLLTGNSYQNVTSVQ